MLALAVAGCGGDDDSSKKADSTARTDTAETEGARTTPAQGKAGGDRPGAKKVPEESKAEKAERIRKDREQEKRELAQLEKEDRNFDKSFKETPFEKLTSQLPVRKAPLYVEQYITGEGHKVYTAVDEKRFLCRMTVAQRKKAVASFFQAADKLMRSGGTDDFVQVVTPLSADIERLPALATARKGSVTLTARGRGRGPC